MSRIDTQFRNLHNSISVTESSRKVKAPSLVTLSVTHDYLPAILIRSAERDLGIMRSIKAHSLALAAATVMGIGGTASLSQDQVKDCNDPSLPNPIYVYGSSAVKPLIAALGNSLWSQSITIVYVDKGGSCNGVNAIVNGNLVAPARNATSTSTS